jgi:hypothetical protein
MEGLTVGREHIYRRHSWKSFCPRCFEHFDKAEALKSHQRADVPCKLRERAPDAITEEQEKLLRARAKSHCSEEMKWEEMYRIIFPDEKVPSPCMPFSTYPFSLDHSALTNSRLRLGQ